MDQSVQTMLTTLTTRAGVQANHACAYLVGVRCNAHGKLLDLVVVCGTEQQQLYRRVLAADGLDQTDCWHNKATQYVRLGQP